jgi:hypothetical protein
MVDSNTVRLLSEWVAEVKAQPARAREATLLGQVRRRTHPETALTALEQLASQHADRLDRIETVLAVVVRQLLERESGERGEREQSEPAPTEARGQGPYRDPGPKAAPPGFFACRRCGAVLPNSQACANADGRFCVDCFEP